jgi:hypothetical protein
VTLVSEEVFESMQPNIVIDASRQMSARKHRHFVCACCRRFWHLLKDPRSQESVRVGELYADNRTTRTNLSIAYKEAFSAQLDEGGHILRDRATLFDQPLNELKIRLNSNGD